MSKIKRFKIKTLILVIFFILITIFISKNYYYINISLYDENIKKIKDTNWGFYNNTNEIIFCGDSLTNGGDWEQMFSNNNIKNKGIGGDTTRGLLRRIELIHRSKPKKIFIMIGINDLRRKINLKRIIQNYSDIIKILKEKSPKTELIVQSVLPVNKEKFGNGIDNKNVIELNQKLKEITQKEKVIFVDLFHLFDDGNINLNKKYTDDGIHLNKNAYVIWKKHISKFIDNKTN